MPFFKSKAFGDQMIAGAEEDAGNPCGLQSVKERLIVRHDDGAMGRRKIKESVIRGSVA